MITEELSAADARLVRWLTGRGGEPLDQPTRELMESRFGVSFGHVRLHTGPLAAAAAARLNARAFVWGRQIVFGEGEYRPGTAEGMRLLAHELTHTVQHPGETVEGQAIRLGSPDDPLEREAELAAERIDSAAPLPNITRGRAPALRRVVVIKAPATTGINLNVGRVVAESTVGVGPGGTGVAANLRNGFNTPNPFRSGEAFTFNAHVGVKLDPGDTLDDFTFGFVQFMRSIDERIVYAGREDREGQIIANPVPLIGTSFLIDRVNVPPATAFSPFMRDPAVVTTFDPVAGEVVTTTGDHPMLFIPQTRTNSATGLPNFIFRILDHREAVSVFVVRDRLARGGRLFIPLAHVRWDLFYDVTFKWRARQVRVATNNSSFTPGKPVKGAPTDKTITDLLATLSPTTGPVYNDRAQPALQAVLTPPNPNTRQLEHYTDVPIPALFFVEGPGSLDIP